jgi:hypothetical protein
MARSVLGANSFLTSTSKAYLIGETYYIQEIQAGIVEVLDTKPPNIVIGITRIGAAATADSGLLKLEEITYPRPLAVKQRRKYTRK